MESTSNVDAFLNFFNSVIKGLEKNEIGYITKIDDKLYIVVEEKVGSSIINKNIYGCLEDYT